MVFKYRRRIVNSYRDNRATGFFGDFETAVMKRQESIIDMIPCSFRENADRDTGFDIFDTGKYGFQTFFDVFAVKEKAVQVAHPVSKQWVTLHFFFGNITGWAGNADICKDDIKITAVVCNVENGFVKGDVFFVKDCDFDTGDTQAQTKYRVNDSK